MSHRISRRKALAGLAAAGGVISARPPRLPFEGTTASAEPIFVTNKQVEASLTLVNSHTLRMSVLELSEGSPKPIENDLVLVRTDWPAPTLTGRSKSSGRSITWEGRDVRVGCDPLSIEIRTPTGKVIQQLRVDSATGSVTFALGGRPICGLGEGNHQFDRRGAVYTMEHGQGGPQFPELGGRMPVPWLISPKGWALFFHRPFGTFDLSGQEARFQLREKAAKLPLDMFVVIGTPTELYFEFASLTGFPHLPPMWSLGYLQSHRTLASREEVLAEARTFREKKLPCDAVIYLGTGFCPSGWNTGHGSFTFNEHVFPDPAEMIRQFHSSGFKVALHVVPKMKDLHGSVEDSGPAATDPEDLAHYWQQHVPDFRLGVDGWWPDEGDWFSESTCLLRNRMYWDGCRQERPNVRPFALHRNGYAGMQRFGWLWSGDIDSTWAALKAQVFVGINTGLSGMPFWGSDTGGFVTTPEFTGELYARWFQFSTFCPLFRSHGRTWKLRLPWGWNSGDYGPTELGGYDGKAGLPDPKELHNAQIEPICRKYLELRYRLMPYTYAAVREAHDTGLPIMRALWLHYPDDPHAAERGDEYLWGRDILVVPIAEPDTSARELYLPSGEWWDFWDEEKLEGGRMISRPVDLATLPLYVRAGALVPTGPVRQFMTEKIDGPLTFTIYPGQDGEFVLYEDDGDSFNYERGEFMRLHAQWNDKTRELSLRVGDGSQLLRPPMSAVEVRLASSTVKYKLVLRDLPTTLKF